jgi:hypothetical protein
VFVTATSALRIERAEAAVTRAVGEAVGAFVRTIGTGVAAYGRPGSPTNKIIGAGLAEPIDEAALAAIEQAVPELRVELCTLAVPESSLALTKRGYHLIGFENVLVRPLRAVPKPAARVERVTPATLAAWRDTTIDAFATEDDTGVPVDHFSREMIAAVIDDVLKTGGFDRYLGFLDAEAAGAASMYLHDGIALLTGSGTLPASRRRGVQTALIAARLADAAARGAELAVITTAPGSQSQANVMKHGFALAYARAILVK